MEEGDDKGEEKRDFSYFFVKFRSFSQAPKKQNYIFSYFFVKIFSFFHKAASLSDLRVTQKVLLRESLFLDFQRESTFCYNFRTAFGTSFSVLSLVSINCCFLTRSTYSFSFLVLLFVRNFDLGRV